MGVLSPWQMLLWIVALVLLLVPPIVVGINAVFMGYYKAKANYLGTVAGAIGKTFEAISEKKKKEKES